MALRVLFNGLIIAGLGLALSGCFGREEAWRGGAYGEGGRGTAGFTLDTAEFDVANAPRACVNDLTIYQAHLQSPEGVSTDLERPVSAYINEAGSARAAINVANREYDELQGDLLRQRRQRITFNASSRVQADAAMEVIEDEMFLNRALAEALDCLD